MESTYKTKQINYIQFSSFIVNTAIYESVNFKIEEKTFFY